MGVAIAAVLLVFCAAFATYPRWRYWRHRWTTRRDIRAITRHLTVINGWIVEYGRDRHIAILHCGHCPNYRRLIDMTGRASSMQALIEFGSRTPCTHQEHQ